MPYITPPPLRIFFRHFLANSLSYCSPFSNGLPVLTLNPEEYNCPSSCGLNGGFSKRLETSVASLYNFNFSSHLARAVVSSGNFSHSAAMAAECEKLPEDTTARARCELKLKLYNDATDVSSLLENPPFSPQELGQLYSSGFNVKTGKPFENGEQYDSEFARKWRKKMRSGGGVMYGNGDSQGTKFWKDILGK